jgi:hypothetical protein
MNRPFSIDTRWRLLAAGAALLLGVGAAGIATGAGGALNRSSDRSYSCYVRVDGGMDWNTMPPRPTTIWVPCSETILRDAWRDA